MALLTKNVGQASRTMTVHERVHAGKKRVRKTLLLDVRTSKENLK